MPSSPDGAKLGIHKPDSPISTLVFRPLITYATSGGAFTYTFFENNPKPTNTTTNKITGTKENT